MPARLRVLRAGKITSVPRGEIPLREELENLHALMERCPGGESELAFFGGSFTAIEPERMDALLLAARGYVDSGAVSGIRISTRPDCINRPVLERLKAAGVTAVELGIQSTDDAVLVRERPRPYRAGQPGRLRARARIRFFACRPDDGRPARLGYAEGAADRARYRRFRL